MIKEPSSGSYEITEERDVFVPARDGTKLAIDIFRPKSAEKFPALLSLSAYGKGYESLDLPPQSPASPLHFQARAIEAGNPRYFVPRGYAHIIGDVRGSGNSEGEFDGFCSKKQAEDGYDLVEWIARQPWCDGKVGMVGISYLGTIQLHVAAEQPPHLKAIVPWNAITDFYREATYHGGILHTAFQWLYSVMIGQDNSVSATRKRLSEKEFRALIERAKKNPDLRMYPALYNYVDSPGKNPCFLDVILNPFDGPYYWEHSAYRKHDRIKVPFYAHSGWWAYAWIHLNGAFSNFNGVNAPKKLDIGGPVDTDHPLPDSYCKEMLRWFDYWLKGIQTGIMEEPPIRIYVMGLNKYRFENEWPLNRSIWTKYYLRNWGGLSTEPELHENPDSYVQQPPSETADISSLSYETQPFTCDVEITGPMALYLNASIDQEDTSWMVSISDTSDTEETELSAGYLKASHRALDETFSKPWAPYHPHTASDEITPGKVYEYAISMSPISNVFKKGHRLKLEISSKDNPGVTSATRNPIRSSSKGSFSAHGVGHHPWHMCSAKTVLHRVFHDQRFRSHILVPVIPETTPVV
jgi:predicted acyl esterase